jgi:ATP phosphoribosyltransferase regulatory subunit
MTTPLSGIPSGIRYYFGDEANLRRTIEQTAMSAFAGWSYEEITAPSVDYYSLFENGMGHAEAQRAFRFTDTDGRLLALRPDVTSAAARAAATLLAERERPLRLCYAGTVFHQTARSHVDWRRESTQIGCELLGSNSELADLEVLAIVVELLNRLELTGSYTITLNDVRIFNGVAERLSLDPASREQLRQVIDTRNAAAVESLLASHTSIEEAHAFAQLSRLAGKLETVDQARKVFANGQSRLGLDRLEKLWKVIESLGLADRFEIDLGDVSRLDYYTGLTFKIYLQGSGSRVGSGGRYDGLTACFGKDEPAVGFVMELDPLTDVLCTKKQVTMRDDAHKAKPLQLQNQDASSLLIEAVGLRAQGERVSLTLG